MSVTSVALRGKLFAEEREEGVDSEGSLQREGKGMERHLLGERFNIVRTVNVKYNGRGKHPKNACSMLGTL